jgi:hypothetical protein
MSMIQPTTVLYVTGILGRNDSTYIKMSQRPKILYQNQYNRGNNSDTQMPC